MKRFFLFGSILFLALSFVFIQRGFLQDSQDRIPPQNVVVTPNEPVDPETAQKLADIKYFRSIGDNAKAVQILNSIPRNVAAVPSLDKYETGAGPTVTPVDNRDSGKKLLSVEWATSDIPVTTGTNMERSPSTEVRYNSVNDTEMYHACEYWTGSAPDQIKLTRSMNHGANWYQAWLFDWSTYELSLPKAKQIHNDYLGVVFQRKFSASDSDIWMWRPKATDFSESTNVYIDNSGATLDVRPEVASDYPYFDPAWVYVVYYRLAGTSSKLMYARSTNGGTSFGTPVAIVNFTSQPSNPDSSIYYMAGELWVAYTYNNTFGKSSIALIKSADYGSTWSTPVTIWSNSGLPALYPGITGATTTRAWIIYNVDYTTDWDTYYHYTTDGTNWYQGWFESSGSYTTRYPSIRYMGGSYVYAAYQYLPNQLIVQKTLYTSPTAWTNLGNIKNSTNTLTADIPALLVSTNPTGSYQASVGWIHQYSVSDYDAYFDAEWLPWAEAAAMGVTPTSGFTSSGLAGGPFSPANTDYLIQNTGGAGMNWTAAKTASATWLTLSATSGYLSAGNAATLTASINSLANSLPAGLYSATITFTNTTNGVGNTTRSVTLYVNAAPTLVVTPAEGLTSQGLPGGPFSPSSKVYTLQNTGGASLNWTAAKTKTWVTLSGTSGTLSSGGSTNVTVSINSNANSLSIGEYTDTVTFTNTTNGVGNTTRPVNLTVGQKMWITVRGTDNWLYSRSMNQLEALSSWAKLSGMTDTTPATAMFNNKFYVIVKSSADTKIWWNRMDSSGVWGSWQAMDGLTGDKPSIAVFNNRLYIAVRGTDDKIWIRYMNTAETFYPWSAVSAGLTSVPPAIQGFNDKLYLVVKDAGDNKIWWTKMDTAGTWSSWSLMDGLSPSTAAMTVFENQLYIAVRGADDKIYYRSMTAAELFTTWGATAGLTTLSPAIESFNSKLYMCVKSNIDTKIWRNSMNTSGVWSGWALMDGLTPSTPSLAGPIY